VPARRFVLTTAIPLIILLMVCPGSAVLQAQEEEATSPIDRAIEELSNWGPLYWKTRLKLKDLGYDSNLFQQEEGQVSSLTATLTPGIDLFLPMGRRQMLWAAEDLDVVYYAKDPPGLYLNNDAALGYDLYLKRIQLSLSDRYKTSLQRPNEEIDARVRRVNNLISGELLLDLSPRVSAGLTHQSDTIRYEDKTVEEPGTPEGLALILDRTERRNGLLLRYDALPRTSFLLKARHTDYDFRDPASTRESTEMRYLVGVAFDPTGLITGELEVGYSLFTADLAPDQDFEGFVGRSEVTWRTKPWFHISVNAERDRRFSTYASNLFYLYEKLEGLVSLRIAGTGWLDLGFGEDRSDYPVADVNIGTDEEPVLVKREDRFTNPILGFRYYPREGMVLGFEARYRSRTSNFAPDFDRLFVAVTISLSR